MGGIAVCSYCLPEVSPGLSSSDHLEDVHRPIVTPYIMHQEKGGEDVMCVCVCVCVCVCTCPKTQYENKGFMTNKTTAPHGDWIQSQLSTT